MSLKRGDTLGGCEILAELGEGGMGTVYRARQTSLGREVALKVMQEQTATPDQQLRFERETRIHVALSHPCVVRIYDSGTDRGRDYLVMELVRGRALEDVIDRDAPMAPPVIARIGRDVIEALGYLHARGIVHRDLKPRNVFLTEEPRAKVGDFGLAWSDGATVLTRQGALVGTVKYLAPESILGANPGPPSDLYALGVFLFRMVTGEVPYEGTSTVDWLKQITKTVPRLTSELRRDVPGSLDTLVARLLLKDPARRATVAEARAVFAALLPPGESSAMEIAVDPAELQDGAPASGAQPSGAQASGARPRVTRKTGRKPIVSTATATPAGAAPARGVLPAAIAALVAFAVTFGIGRALQAPPPSGELPPIALEGAPAGSVPATPPSPAVQPVPLIFFATAKDPWTEVDRAVRGRPLPEGRGAAGFLITDPARVLEATLSQCPLPLAAINASAPEPASLTPDGVQTLPVLSLRAGWNSVEWPSGPAELARVKLKLRVDAARAPAAARIPELPPALAPREPEFWRLLGGGLSVLDSEKLARAMLKEAPGDGAVLRLLGTALVVIARHRRELDTSKDSDTYLATAGVLETDSRPTRDLAAEGTAVLLSAIDQEPRDAEAWAYLAVGLAVLDRLDLADDAVRHACAIGPEVYAAWYQDYEVLEIARVAGRLDRARTDRAIASLKVAERIAARGPSETHRRQVAGALKQLTSKDRGGY